MFRIAVMSLFLITLSACGTFAQGPNATQPGGISGTLEFGPGDVEMADIHCQGHATEQDHQQDSNHDDYCTFGRRSPERGNI